ncbi:phosphoribosylformylglycinamidine synthase [Wenzhouxiangella sp. EGI_FJ10305]|uniref:phosphoribosylformylglycinamidine synthase n=1 Tax=Wenzhouxiangella sp. EGI_FJ10305 TaxID=3243768 RepID=UPI0035DB5ED8
MIVLLGRDSLPPFRLSQLAAELSALQGCKIQVRARELFLVASECLPDEPQRHRLLSLLSARPLEGDTLSARQLLVVPRPGTVTPWASKAGDILRRCDLAAFSRLEHATLFDFEGIEVADLVPTARRRLYDRMTQMVVDDLHTLQGWFDERAPAPLGVLKLGADAAATLSVHNRELGLALSDDEITYLVDAYGRMGRDPSDAELMMFAQANSEHCRHKIFNASWSVDGKTVDGSLFGLIRSTHAATPDATLVAYDDNAAVIEGFDVEILSTSPQSPAYVHQPGRAHIQIKVETHNHPTAISPDPGAATGSGGEIRDEAATGRGARPITALCGFSVSDLHIPDRVQPWENAPEQPDRMASALEIMRDGPIGAARFNNEFGRPVLLGYFRTFSARIGERLWGYHKPIMIAGGSGMIAEGQTHKKALAAGDRIIVLGGPAMLIGLGGGAASSMSSGQSDADLDFASVQRGNPEMQRRAQEVIDRCWLQGENNPIKSIHDVGAGGLSNALPELLHDGGVGGRLELRDIPTNDPALSPMEIWCNEAQERYVLAVAPADLDRFAALCERERCPWADVGEATDDGQLVLADRQGTRPAVDMSLEVLLGKAPRMHRDAVTERVVPEAGVLDGVTLDDAVNRVLSLPSVGSKQFLITIGDRTVGGLSVRDQMVGPHQVPVADCAISLLEYDGYAGTAMAMGERTPLAVHDSAAAARVAVGEVLTNLAAVAVRDRSHIKLSANWMAAAGAPGQDAALREAVEAVAALCPELDLSVPVGKDSLSMQTVWNDGGEEQRMTAPVSLIVTGFAPVPDVRRQLTPELRSEIDTRLVLIDLGRRRLGGSALAQVYSRQLGDVPDVDDLSTLKSAFDAVQKLVAGERILACHDRSDGGLFTTVLEMALAGRCGLRLNLGADEHDPMAALFNEELGLVLQVAAAELPEVESELARAGLGERTSIIGEVAGGHRLEISAGEREVFRRNLPDLAGRWAETSYRMQRLRDHPACADEEFEAMTDFGRSGLDAKLTFEPPASAAVNTGARPRVAILREQGVNGQREMARAFMSAGFEAVDVHMSDLEHGRQELADFHGLAACGGFSFGDVLGAGQGWARSILFNESLRDAFQAFFEDSGRFALGVCNGCQMLSALREIIPGAAAWPDFVANRSRQFEARLSQVAIEESPSIFFTGMAGSRLPVVTSHGEGRAQPGERPMADLPVAVRYVREDGAPALSYPDNPNGSPDGITGLTSATGRVTIMMPHPERLLRAVNFSWAPREWGELSPWMKMFHNARLWLE